MAKEFPAWMDRTAVAVKERNLGRSITKDAEVSESAKKKILKSVLEETIYYWDFLNIDRALSNVAKTFDLQVADKIVWGLPEGDTKIDPRENLYARVLKSLDIKSESLGLIKLIGIETTVWDEKVDGFTRLDFTLRTDEIYIGSVQPDPSKNNPSYLINVIQDLGNPSTIRNATIFRDRLDGYMENLVRKYPTFYPKKN
ncbi:MAG TPA: hypothetical protein VKC54_04440 [Patescibacteria group bacterium]|nr:hypothetical protein [Patescibacteria group bacterium]